MAAMRSGEIRLNTDTGLLKVIAMITMVIDHVGAVFFPQYRILRIIGRIAFPIYAYCIAVGCVYTHNPAKYALRVLFLALLSQPIYVIALRHISAPMQAVLSAGVTPMNLLKWFTLSMRSANILFTLLLGILIIWSLRERKYIVTGALVLCTWYFSGYINYGWPGVVLMLIFYAFLDRPATSFVWVGGFMLWWALTRNTSFAWNGIRYGLQLYALMALLLIYLPTKTGIKLPKWVFYFFYPAHLLAIYAVTLIQGG